MKTEIEKFLNNLPDDLEIIKQQAIKYYDFDNKAAIRNDGAVQILNRTWIAPLNFGFLLFPATDKLVIDK